MHLIAFCSTVHITSAQHQITIISETFQYMKMWNFIKRKKKLLLYCPCLNKPYIYIIFKYLLTDRWNIKPINAHYDVLQVVLSIDVYQCLCLSMRGCLYERHQGSIAFSIVQHRSENMNFVKRIYHKKNKNKNVHCIKANVCSFVHYCGFGAPYSNYSTCPRVFIAALKILWNFVPAAQQTYIQL